MFTYQYVALSVFPLIIAAALIYIWYSNKSGRHFVRTIQPMIKRLSTQTSNESVSEFIDELNSIKRLPNHPTVWDSLRAACSMVIENKNVNIDLKKQLRNTLMGLGVDRLPKL